MSKQYLDHCFYCGEHKEAVRYEQRRGNGLICGIVDSQTGELLSEIKNGRHTFVVTEKEIAARKADELAEAEMYADMAEWMKNNPLEAEL